MRAIGKGSLSSILAVGLHITRVILFVALFGLAMAMIFMPLASGVGEMAAGMENVDIDGDVSISRGDYFDVAYNFIAVLVMLYVVTRLLEILKTLRFGSPFVKENANRFRQVGYALLIGEGAEIRFQFSGAHLWG